MVDGNIGASAVSDDDDEPPVAPPEEDSTPVIFAHDLDGPVLAPPEHSDERSVYQHGVRLVEQVYTDSYAVGAEVAMEVVRSLHPNWSECEMDTEIGRWVKWARCSNDWVYGEMSPRSFETLLDALAECNRPRTFVDLGSGTGMLTALASLRFSNVLGIELQSNLDKVAQSYLSEFRRDVQKHGLQVGDINLFAADFLGRMTPHWQNSQGQYWWDVADVVYTCSPKFSQETMRKISSFAEQMRPDSLFFTVRHRLESGLFTEVRRDEASFSWGVDDLIMHRLSRK